MHWYMKCCLFDRWNLSDLGQSYPGGSSGTEPTCQCRRGKRYRFNRGSGRFPWKRAWPPTPVLLPGESPRTKEPGGLQYMGSQRVGHDWSNFTHVEVDPCRSNLDCSRVNFSCFFENVFSIMWKSFHQANHIKRSRRLCLQDCSGDIISAFLVLRFDKPI